MTETNRERRSRLRVSQIERTTNKIYERINEAALDRRDSSYDDRRSEHDEIINEMIGNTEEGRR